MPDCPTRRFAASIAIRLFTLSIVAGAGTSPVFARGQEFSIGLNFTGTDRAAELFVSNGSFLTPPDTMGAVGPTHIGEILNGAFAVYNKADGSLVQRTTQDQFWNTAFTNSGSGLTVNNSFDPRMVYDPAAGRWYAVAVDGGRGTASRVLVAATIGDDPSGPEAWHAFAIDADSTNARWADFPTIGFNADGLFISNNMLPVTTGGSATTVIGVPKSSLTAAMPTIAGFVIQEAIGPINTGPSLQPAVDLNNSSSPLPALSSINKAAGNLKRSDFPADFFTSATLSTSGGLISVTPRPTPPLARQPGPDDNINTADSRIGGNVVLQGDSIWASHMVRINGRAALEWYQIDRATNAVLQSGTIADTGMDYYYPSIAVNPLGDVVLGFSGSSDTVPISTYVLVGDTVGGLTTFGEITQTQIGADSFVILDGSNRNRWGDYSATVVDPDNPLVFWTFQEFVAADRDPDGPGGLGIADNNWAIQITQIIIVPEPSALALAALGLACLATRRTKTPAG